MDGRIKGLILGAALGAAVAGLAAAGWWWLRAPALSEKQWLARIAESPDAADKLVGMGDQGLAVLLRARESDDIVVHRRAVRALASMGEVAAKPLVRALPRAGGRAEVALVALGEKAVPALEEALGSEASAAAARALGKLGPRAKAARSALMGLAQSEKLDEKARAEAAFALGLLGPDEAAQAVLASSARSGPRLVRLHAIRALGLLGESARPAVPALTRILEEPDEELAWAAATVLGSLRVATAAPAMARLAAERWEDEPVLAIATLGEAARPGLPALLRPGPWSLAREAAARSLGPPLAGDLAELASNPELGPQALRWLTAMGPLASNAAASLTANPATAEAILACTPEGTPEAVRAILARLTPSPEAERITLGTALLGLSEHPLAALSPLAVALGRTDPDAPSLAWALRYAAPSPEVVAFLASGTRRPDIDEACLAALHSLGPAAKPALPQVREALKGRWPVHAAIALLSIDPAGERERALPVLREALRTPQGRSAIPPILPSLPDPPAELLEEMRADLGMFLLPLANFSREERLGVAPDLVRLVTGSPGPVRGRLAARLRELGPAVLPFLRPLFKSEHLPRIAGLLGDPALELPNADLEVIARRTSDPDENVRQAAASVLASLGARTDACVEAALGLLSHAEPEMRAAAARSLRPARDRAAVALRELLYDPSDAVRAAAAHALAGDDALRVALRDGSPEVRLEAGLGLLKGSARQEATRELLRLARHASPTGRLAVAQALGDEAGELAALLEVDSRSLDVEHALPAAAWLVRHSPAHSARALLRLAAGLDESDDAARLLAGLGPLARPITPWLRRHLRLQQPRPTREALEAALKATG
jgi:HEAT repeat protein